MKVETVSIGRLKPAKYNPRQDLKPGDPEYDKLKKSITEFNLVEPLIWNKKTGNVVSGHQRLKVLQEMGVTEVDVSVVSLTLAKEKALNLALNKIQGDWELPKLKDLLQELDTGAFDMEITGFDQTEIEALMTQIHVDFGNYTGPGQEQINQRGEELKNKFKQLAEAFMKSKVELVCPECGAEFSMDRADLLKETTT